MKRAVIYYAFDTEKISENEMRIMEGIIPYFRLQKADSYIRKKDRNNCIATYLLLKYGLYENFGINKFPDVVYNKYGKPEFRNIENIFFNLSHSAGAVCCGISHKNIGVDIQESIMDYEGILNIAMSRQEIRNIKEAENPHQLAARYWSLKEAYTKYLGIGLTENIKYYDFSFFKDDSFEYMDLHFSSKQCGGYSISSSTSVSEHQYVEISITDCIKRLKG